MALTMSVEHQKPTLTSSQLPSPKTPTFSGGKLASIRRKLDEKELLLAGGIPFQLLKRLDTQAREHVTETGSQTIIPETVTRSASKSNVAEQEMKTMVVDKEGAIEDKITTPVLCKFCGRVYPPGRILLHQKICSELAENLRKRVPFIVKLGIRQVDGDKDIIQLLKKDKLDESHEEEEGMLHTKDEFGYQGEEKEELPIMPQFSAYPGGGRNWTEEHEQYMSCLEEAKATMELFASGNIPGLPPPPGPNELEVEYVQCPSCLRRFAENYNASDHLAKCMTRRAIYSNLNR